MLKLNAKEKFMVGVTVMCTVLIACALACTIVLAAFTASKQATTTIQFHGGITLSLTGVTDNKWTYKCNNTGSYGTTGNPLKQLDLSSIKAKFKNSSAKDSQTTVYVRVFVLLTTDSTGTLPTITGNITYTSNTSSILTANENTFVNNNKLTNTNTTYAVATYNTTTGTSSNYGAEVTIINGLNIFTTDTQGDWNGTQLKAYFRVYASLTSGVWDQSATFSFN